MLKKTFCLILSFAFLVAPAFPAWPMGHRPPLETSEAATSLPPNIMSFEDCYRLALERSETVAIQKEEIEEAEAQFFKAASEVLGDVDFEITDSRKDIQKGGSSDGVGSSFTDPARAERRFVITQPLFQGFKALGALTGAGSLKWEQEEEWLRAQQLLLRDVANAFYGLLREQKNLEIIQEILILFQERIKELEERERIGRSRTSEVATARARIRILQAEQAAAKGNTEIARYVLEFLTGMELENHILADDEFTNQTPLALPEYLLAVEERADVIAAEQSMKTAWRGVIVAQSELWPDLSLEHIQYERREGFQSNIDWEFLFKVNVPLFRGGETVGEIKESISQWKKEKLSYSLIKRKTELEIKEGYQNWFASIEQSRALEEAVKASHENFLLQKEEYGRNLVNNLEVLEALESFNQTRRDANRAFYQMKINYWGLKVAIGEFPFE